MKKDLEALDRLIKRFNMLYETDELQEDLYNDLMLLNEALTDKDKQIKELKVDWKESVVALGEACLENDKMRIKCNTLQSKLDKATKVYNEMMIDVNNEDDIHYSDVEDLGKILK